MCTTCMPGTHRSQKSVFHPPNYAVLKLFPSSFQCPFWALRCLRWFFCSSLRNISTTRNKPNRDASLFCNLDTTYWTFLPLQHLVFWSSSLKSLNLYSQMLWSLACGINLGNMMEHSKNPLLSIIKWKGEVFVTSFMLVSPPRI